MIATRNNSGRGLTLLELLLALTISAMVAAAIAGMLGAVSSGVGVRRDTRDVMVQASAAQSRLAAYVAPSRCLLGVDGPCVVLWHNDARAGGTVHATELRWLLYCDATGDADDSIIVYYVDFPDGWTQTARDIEDLEYASDADWMAVLAYYQGKGWVSSRTIVDGLDSAAVAIDGASAMSSRHVNYELSYITEQGVIAVNVAGTIRQHVVPSN